MARLSRTPIFPPAEAGVSQRGNLSPEQRETMIREAAYYRYLKRGATSGHDLDDWLAAEAELNYGAAEESLAEYEVQQSSVRGPAADDELKRMVRQHPRRDIPLVESVEPPEAPARE